MLKSEIRTNKSNNAVGLGQIKSAPKAGDGTVHCIKEILDYIMRTVELVFSNIAEKVKILKIELGLWLMFRDHA